MKVIQGVETIVIPKDVKVTVEARHVTVEGKHGKLERSFRFLPIDLALIDGGKKLQATCYNGLSKQLQCLRTTTAHINNMIKGVRQKFQYKMRLVYAHFPINANIINGGKTIEIRNFLGEKVVRTIDMVGEAKVEKSNDVKDELIIQATGIEDAGQSAALIHQSCLVKKKDIRKFLDGIYVASSGTVFDLEE